MMKNRYPMLALVLFVACGGTAASSPPPEHPVAAKEEPSTTSVKASSVADPSSAASPSTPTADPQPASADEVPPKPTSNASDALWAEARRKQQASVDAEVQRLDAELTKLEQTKAPWTVNEVNATADARGVLKSLLERSKDERLEVLRNRYNAIHPVAQRTRSVLVKKCEAAKAKSKAGYDTSRDMLQRALSSNGCFQGCRALGTPEEPCFERCVISREEQARYGVYRSSMLAVVRDMSIRCEGPIDGIVSPQGGAALGDPL